MNIQIDMDVTEIAEQVSRLSLASVQVKSYSDLIRKAFTALAIVYPAQIHFADPDKARSFLRQNDLSARQISYRDRLRALKGEQTESEAVAIPESLIQAAAERGASQRN